MSTMLLLNSFRHEKYELLNGILQVMMCGWKDRIGGFFKNWTDDD